MQKTKYRLVADIGGTNIRLALCESGSEHLIAVQKLPCAQFDSLQSALAQYLSDYASDKAVIEACLAIAGPVTGDQISMTNLPWTFSKNELRQQLQLDTLDVLNDFAAVAASIPHLHANDLHQIGGGTADKSAPILAIGAGTGLGMASVVANADGYQTFPAEGGHACISAETAVERQIVDFHAEKSPKKLTPCREFFLSGRGLQSIYEGLGGSEKISPAEISERACNNSDLLCRQTLSIFCAWLGSTCGDQAVSAGSLGGVYIAGGMVKQFLPFLEQSDFRQRFENKGAMRAYLQRIPSYVVTREHVALLGNAKATLSRA
ncbi:MAG: glucokinase [Pseudomonadales bacterium]